MNAGGFSEAIWHFAGYLHLDENIFTTELTYDGGYFEPKADDDPAAFTNPARPSQFDESTSQRVGFQETATSDASQHIQRSSIPGFVAPQVHDVPQHQAEPLLHPSDEPDLLNVQLIRINHLIAVQYQDGGTQTLLSAHQINTMDDRDTIVTDMVRSANGDIFIPPEIHTAAALASMMAEARDATPQSMPADASGNTQALIAAISSRDEYWATHGHVAGEYASSDAPAGRIVDGHASSDPLPEPTAAQITPWQPAVAPEVHEITETVMTAGPTQGVGTVAETGQNTQINEAGILDVDEASGSLMIGGNYYFSRGIVQVNVLVDNAHVDVTTNQSVPAIATEGNEVHNVAEFINHSITASYHGATATPTWSVDVLQGNFYDVKSVVQFNGLDDSDRVVQATAGTYYEADTGHNQQINLAQVTNIDSYDLIIVGGDYHRADWIYQYNVMLASSGVQLFASGSADGVSQDVTTGFNRLTNTANITTYDSTAFQPLNAAQHDLLDGLASKVTVLAPNSDWHLAGDASGPLKVLYVSGAYYDVNVISQVNVLANVDQVIQATATPHSQQAVATGGNVALNDAQIIDPGTLSTDQYLGGQAYEDSILIQTNLVTAHDTVTIHDTSTLVPELAAFTHDAEPAGSTDALLTKPIDLSHHDILI
jgi:hypothetical protein